MQTDVNGCNTCQAGQEHYEEFPTAGGTRIQYDYRTPDGKLFSTIGKTLAACRQRRDEWLARQ